MKLHREDHELGEKYTAETDYMPAIVSVVIILGFTVAVIEFTGLADNLIKFLN